MIPKIAYMLKWAEHLEMGLPGQLDEEGRVMRLSCNTRLYSGSLSPLSILMRSCSISVGKSIQHFQVVETCICKMEKNMG